MIKKKKIFVFGLVGLVGAVLTWFLLRTNASAFEGRLQYAEVKRGDLEVVVTSTGTLSAVGTVEVGAQVSADLEKIFVDYNDKVKKGQVLAVFDTTLFKAEVTKAEAEVIRSRVKLEQAQAEYKRNQPLFDKGFLSETEFLTVRYELESARAQLQVAKANLDSAKTNLKYAVIRSPIDGTVIERSAEVGQTIVSRMSPPKLFIIAADLSKMQIEVDVDESDIGQIKEAQSARFTVQAYPNENYRGKVRQIRLQPKTVQNVVNYTVIVDATNESERLLPGMTAIVDFLIEEKKNVLLVPNKAVLFRPSPEVIAKYMDGPPARRQRGKRTRRPFENGHGGPEQDGSFARVYTTTDNGKIRPVVFVPGISDGKETEIKESQNIFEGMKIVVGFETDKKKSQDRGFGFPRPRGRGPRAM